MRRKLGGIVLAVAALMLTACGQVIAPHQHPLALTSHPAAPSQTCSSTAGSSTQIGDLLITMRTGIILPARELPAGIPLKPDQVPNPSDAAALDAQIPPTPQVNPQMMGSGGLLVDICNASTTTSHLIQGGILKITSFSPFADGVNSWNPCDGVFTRSVAGGVTQAGCGGSITFDEELRVTFPAQAGAGFASTAVPESSNSQLHGFGPLPVTLQPGKTITLHLSVTMPTVPGLYALAFSLEADHAQLAFLAALPPTLFAPVAHKFTGAACLLPQMNQQIPPGTTPLTFFICPEGVTVVPTAAPGRG
jgi:hypothetical protein